MLSLPRSYNGLIHNRQRAKATSLPTEPHSSARPSARKSLPPTDSDRDYKRAILYGVVCWGSRLRVEDTVRLKRLIRKASNIVGVKLDSLTVVSERRILSKLHKP
ncbi:hypothetical protein ILYODFUR_025759 [Ilyodon furcidens]|uniref:Uncharacterized protein n=1 Tax=Ilyodon furcidens TaxID=33524 RepID=A0ABV0VH78_9TELE